jgi:predicted small lipoprotein YifL
VAKQILEQELPPIELQNAAHPQGVSISELEAALASVGVVINRRTLLRRLTVLIEHNRITATGILKGRLYLPPVAKTAEATSSPE